MVRAHVKPPPEEKKEASQKKKPHSKTGLWACKINDCNKCFAREADLKRHQRTTKGHSQPGYACPQCDATFTRTDALRRHQKSRHNGVIVESSNSAKTSGDDSDHTDASMSSPSRDPSPGKEEPQDTSPPKLESAARANYYRSQAARPHYGSPLPPPPAIFIEGGYSHAIAIPTSAARLQWPSTPPWSAEGSPAPPPPPQLYPLSSYYTPSSYYRHGPPILPPGHPLPYPPDYMAHVMHPGGPPPPGIYHAHAPSISATRSANAEDSDLDTDGQSEDEHELDHEDADSEPDEDDDEDDQDEEHSIGQCAGDDEKVRRISISDQQQKRAEDDNGTRSKDERCSSPVDEDDFERESTAKVSPSTPPSSLASILGPSRSGYFEDLEEDTLSPRMRDVALDGPLLIMAREPLTSLRA